MVRIFGLRQNNRYYAQFLSRPIGTTRSVVSFSVRSETNGEMPNKKAPRSPSNNTGYCQYEPRSGSVSRIEKTTSLSRGSGPKEDRLACVALTQLEMVHRSEPNRSIRFQTMASPNIKRMPRETEKQSLMMTGAEQIGGPRPGGRHQDGYGMTKSEDFFRLQISHPRSGNYCVCDG